MDQPIQLNIFFNSPLSPIGLESELHRTSPSLITEIYQFPISPMWLWAMHTMHPILM